VKRLAAIVLVVLIAALPFGCTPPVEREGPEVTAGVTAPATDLAEIDTPDEAGDDPAVPDLDKLPVDELVKRVMKAKNPAFEGEIGIRSDDSGVVRIVAVNDPAVEDISALEDLPLMAIDLRGCHVKDISALRGAPLREAYLEDTGIDDIGPLKGAPLEKLYLSNTRVKDISPLKGAPLKELNMVGAKVSDLSPLEGSPLRMLWVTDCPVSDVGPLAKVPVVSVTLENTLISDLGPLKGHPTLERLHIAGTRVTDLSVLEWIPGLTRLIFTPSRIEKGIEAAKGLPRMREIGTGFDSRMPPSQFWQRYDEGEFK